MTSLSTSQSRQSSIGTASNHHDYFSIWRTKRSLKKRSWDVRKSAKWLARAMQQTILDCVVESIDGPWRVAKSFGRKDSVSKRKLSQQSHAVVQYSRKITWEEFQKFVEGINKEVCEGNVKNGTLLYFSKPLYVTGASKPNLKGHVNNFNSIWMMWGYHENHKNNLNHSSWKKRRIETVLLKIQHVERQSAVPRR